jgi:hypothetical protein
MKNSFEVDFSPKEIKKMKESFSQAKEFFERTLLYEELKIVKSKKKMIEVEGLIPDSVKNEIINLCISQFSYLISGIIDEEEFKKNTQKYLETYLVIFQNQLQKGTETNNDSPSYIR